MNFPRITITALNEKHLEDVPNVLQWCLMVVIAIEFKLYGEPPIKHKRKLPENICKVYFSSKAVELIILSSILNNTQLISLLKDLPCKFVTSTVVSCLQQPTSSSIFNFKKLCQCQC